MQYEILHQAHYSRGQLLLRSLLGMVYLVLPHLLILIVLSALVPVLAFCAWWVMLITGHTPDWYYAFFTGLTRWWQRFIARFIHLADCYPAFGFTTIDAAVRLEVERVHIGRVQLLLRTVLGWLLIIPHIFLLYFRTIGTCLMIIGAWWSVLITGRYPATWHAFTVGTLRWYTRLFLWATGLRLSFPPFNGRPDNSSSPVSGAEYTSDN